MRRNAPILTAALGKAGPTAWSLVGGTVGVAALGLIQGCSPVDLWQRTWDRIQGEQEQVPACPAGTTRELGGHPFVGEGWTLSRESAEVSWLEDAWPFPAFRALGEGDTFTACIGADGRREGPFQQARGVTRVVGQWAGGLREGVWKGEWKRGGALAFEGRYERGNRVGEWRFNGADGLPVASGGYVQDLPWGRWTFLARGGRVDADFVSGKVHGAFSQVQADGTEINGAHFDGSRFGRWVERSSEGHTSSTWWLDGAQMADGGTEPGRREVELVVRAWLNGGLGGGWIDAAEARKHPVLLANADPSLALRVRQEGLPLADGDLSLVGEWSIVGLQVGEKTASVQTRVEVHCAIDAQGRPYASRESRDLPLALALVDGVWMLDGAPLAHALVYRSYYLSHLTWQGDGRYRQVLKECGAGQVTADPSDRKQRGRPVPARKLGPRKKGTVPAKRPGGPGNRG